MRGTSDDTPLPSAAPATTRAVTSFALVFAARRRMICSGGAQGHDAERDRLGRAARRRCSARRRSRRTAPTRPLTAGAIQAGNGGVWTIAVIVATVTTGPPGSRKTSRSRTSWRRRAPDRRPKKRQRLDELTSVLGGGDGVVVSELTRFGRSRGQVVTVVAIVDALGNAGGGCVCLKGNIRVEGKRVIQTEVMTTLLALFGGGGAGLDLGAQPQGLRRGASPRAGSLGARRARWASHGSTARRTRSGGSGSSAS